MRVTEAQAVRHLHRVADDLDRLHGEVRAGDLHEALCDNYSHEQFGWISEAKFEALCERVADDRLDR